MARAAVDAERITRDYLDVWNDRAYSRIPEVVTESFVMYDPFAPGDAVTGPRGEAHGPEGLESFIRGVVEGFPDFHVTVLDLLSDGRTAMYEGRITMTHEGTYFGMPPTGKRAEFRYMGRTWIDDDKVEEHRVYPPLREVLEQLDLTFPAILPQLPKLAWGFLKHHARGAVGRFR